MACGRPRKFEPYWMQLAPFSGQFWRATHGENADFNCGDF